MHAAFWHFARSNANRHFRIIGRDPSVYASDRVLQVARLCCLLRVGGLLSLSTAILFVGESPPRCRALPKGTYDAPLKDIGRKGMTLEEQQEERAECKRRDDEWHKIMPQEEEPAKQ
jgi:hypothetical protein